MSELLARTGRHQQRYEDGYRLIAGCIPFKYIYTEKSGDDSSEMIVEVLMINSISGPGLLFPKGGSENDETAEEAAVREAVEEAGVQGDLMHYLGCRNFKSKTLQDEYSPEGLCRAYMYALYVEEELQSWPEKSHRKKLAKHYRSHCMLQTCLDPRGCRRRFFKVVDDMVRTLPLKRTS